MREPTPPARRSLAGLPRLLRPAGGELLHHDRAAHQRGLRLHLDAHQRAARRAAHPRRGRLRRVAARPSARRSTPSTRPAARRRPTSSRGRSPWSRRCSTRCASRASRSRATRPTTSSPRSPPRPTAQGIDVLICSGDRDALQLVSDQVTVLYPVKGVSELARMTPEAVAGEVRRPARALQRPRGARRRVLATTCRACPGSGPRPRPSGSTSTATSTGVVAHVDQIKGKAGESLREHLDGVLRNRRLNQLVSDVAARGRGRRPGPPVWDRDAGPPGLRRAGVPGAARPALRHPRGGRAGGRGRASTSTAACSPPSEVPAWLDEHAAPGARVGVARRRRVGPRHR